MKIAGLNQPAEEKDISSIEEKFCITFPEEYRRFLLSHDGGEPHKNTFIRGIDEITVAVFLSCHSVIETDTLLWKGNVFFSGQRIPDSIFPIADALNDLICIGVKGENLGKIFLWDSSNEKNLDEVDFSNVKLLSNSLSEFLNLLKPEDD